MRQPRGVGTYHQVTGQRAQTNGQPEKQQTVRVASSRRTAPVACPTASQSNQCLKALLITICMVQGAVYVDAVKFSCHKLLKKELLYRQRNLSS